MPPTTRRTSANARASSSGRQATISFNHRVTKPTGPNATKAKSGKDLVSSSSSPSIITSQPTKQSPLAKNVTTSAQPEDAADEDEESLIKDAEELNEEAQLEEPEAEKEAVEKSEAAQRADTITDRQIGMYWRLLERRRTAARIHQEDLTLAEKVLRYWDVSSQYGPCVGIDRMKRWKRADRLGLNPPLEVLAVLRKEEEKKTQNFQRAHIDEILNSTAAGAV